MIKYVLSAFPEFYLRSSPRGARHGVMSTDQNFT